MKLTKQNVARVQAAHNALTIAGGQQGKTIVFSDYAHVVVVVSPELVKGHWGGGKGSYPEQLHLVVGSRFLKTSEVEQIIRESK